MKEYKIGDYYDLREDQKTILSKEEENGYQDQYFEREDIKWIVLDENKDTGELLLISEKPTRQKIYLQGQEGYDNGIKILDQLCKDITGVDTARNLTKEDVEKLEYWKDKDNTRAEIIFGEEDDFYYWLSSRFVLLNSSICYFGLQRVSSSGVCGINLYNSNGNTGNSNFIAVRPVVYIKPGKVKMK